uniref:class II glutamine amidotransferase n=1 Tax=Nocardia abscessus TaxID=120957 RepID=UPI003CC7CABE
AVSATEAAPVGGRLCYLRATCSRQGVWSAAPAALRLLVSAILDRAPEARLNLLLSDGAQLWATTCHHSLSVLVTDEFALMSSEPFDDDPRWRSIPDRCLVSARPGALSVDALL